MVEDYMRECGRYIYEALEASMDDNTGEDLWQAVLKAKESAAGMGQWVPGDFKLLPMRVFNYLVDLPNMVGNGARWPT